MSFRTPKAPDVGDLAGYLRALHSRLDDVRVCEHLRRTERTLRETEHDALDAEQRRRRDDALDRLAAYRSRGEFPTNRTVAGRVPLFVGDDGTPCAVAHLLLSDGREDLVADVMATEPTVAVEELPDDHPVIEWVEANGLTRGEAARIQPTYPDGVQFATTCGPIACWLVGALAATVSTGVFAALEYAGYRVAADSFPENALKRRGFIGYVTVLNLILGSLLALLLFALFP